MNAAAELGIQAHALYWVVPDIHFVQDADVTVVRAMTETPYSGFKLHPRAQQWDLQDARTAALAEEVFAYTEQHGKRVLIHCGDDPCESPRLFEPFIQKHPHVPVQLAHCRSAAETLAVCTSYSFHGIKISSAQPILSILLVRKGIGKKTEKIFSKMH